MEINPYGYTQDTFEYLMKISENKLRHQIFNQKSNNLPTKFNISTYNIWGVNHFNFSFLEMRLPYIIEIIKNSGSDIFCLQEVSQSVLDAFLQNQWIQNNYEFSEKIINWSERANVICLTLTKYKPLRVAIYLLTGGLFSSDIICTEFNDRIIINTSLHPGCKFSPGISDSSNYAKCRIEQIKIIHNLINLINPFKKTMYLCGDFNIDFNGNLSDWPELDSIKNLNFVDTWEILKPTEKGYTEDTIVNEMRWNTKQIEKQVRYDAILYTPNQFTQPLNIEIFGNTQICQLPFQQFADATKHLQLTIKKGFKVNGTMIFDENQITNLNWYPSDHFGVTAQFQQFDSTLVHSR